MAEISAGAVSLDLVIKDTLDKQLAGIKSRVESVFNKSAELAQSSLSKTARSAAETTSQTVKEVESANNGIAKAVAECMQRIEDQQKRVVESAAQAASSVKPQEIRLNINTDYDPSVVEAQVNEITKGIEDKLNGVKEKSKEVFEGFDIPDSAVERLQAQFELIGEKSEELQSKYKELQKELSNTDDDDAAAKIVREMSEVEAKLISLADKADKTREKIDAALNDDGDPQVEESIKKVERSANKASSSIRNRFGGAFRSVKNISQKAFGSVKERIKSIGDSANAVTKPVESLFKRIRNGARRIFIMAGILSVLKSMRSALSDAASSNKQFSDSLESIKFNLAVAFQPILTAVMPMLNTLMSGIAGVTEKIAAFTSALFGKTYQQSAQAVAKSKQAAAAAKNAGKEAKAASKYLADFDEMRVHQDSSDSSSGADSSETDYSKYTGKDVKLSDWAEKFKSSIKSGDWAGAGKLLAEKVNGVFDRIKWDKVREKLTKGARKAADAINGFSENLKWKEIGNSIGEGITTAFSAAYTFLKTTKWKSIGSGFADFLNGVMQKTDFDKVGRTLGQKVNAVVGLALGFVTTFNFAAAGLGLADVINGWFNEVNWDDVGSMIGGALEGAIDFAFSFVDRFDAENAALSITAAFNKAVGKVDAKKLGKTLTNAFTKVWNFISTALENIDWNDVGNKISDFINNINWKEILDSMFEVVAAIIKNTPELLEGIIRNLDFENAAGLFATLFAPKMANNLLNHFKTNKDTQSTLTDAGKSAGNTVGKGVSDQGSKWGHSMGETLKAGFEAFAVGWAIGSYIYHLWGDKIDAAFEKIGGRAADKLKDQLQQVADEKDFETKKAIGKKYEALGYKIDYSSAAALEKSINSATTSQVQKNQQSKAVTAASTNTPTVSERLQQQKINDEIKRLKAIYTNMPSSALESMARSNLGIPKLAQGGIVKAPTLALVGDNADARSNPVVVAPLSELQQLLGGGGDVVRYLQQIIMLLETMGFDIHTDIDGQTLFRTVVKHNASYKARTGASAF